MEEKLDFAPVHCVQNATGEWRISATIDPRLVGAAVEELKRLDALGEKVADIVEVDHSGFQPSWASKQ